VAGALQGFGEVGANRGHKLGGRWSAIGSAFEAYRCRMDAKPPDVLNVASPAPGTGGQQGLGGQHSLGSRVPPCRRDSTRGGAQP